MAGGRRARARAARPRPASGAVARARQLEVRPVVVGPHARLGVAWFAVTTVAVGAGPAWLAAVLAPVAGLAAVQAGRSWRRRGRRGRRGRRAAVPVAGAGASALVLAAVAGPVAVAVVAAVLAGLVLAGGRLAPGGRRVDPWLTLVIAATAGLAGAAPVLLRHDAFLPVLVLMTYAHVHDAGAYVVGTGASSAWEGPAAGVASIMAVTLAVAAVLVPPFRGASPWALGALAAVLAPLGPYAGSALLGDRRARAPALRRLDSLLLLGPLWTLAAALLLD